MKGSNLVALILVLLSFFLFSHIVSAVEPNGAAVSEVRTERAGSDTAGNDSAMAGNITELIVFGYSTTSAWQGYIGNVSGAIELADASGEVLYNWTLTSPSGEVYASVNSTITWANIQCFNFTANGSNMAGIGETAGGTNLGGLNLTALESAYGIASGDADGVDVTFSDANSHVQFFTANRQFSAGECASSDLYDSTGGSTDGNFEEVLLYEPATASVVFAALLEDNQNGYDSNGHDFQMLVLEDGHDAQATSTTSYYFFVELE